MADPVTSAASRCAGCALLKVPKSDPQAVLRRLPAELFNQAKPEQEFFPGSEWEEEVIADQAIFGVVPGIGITPQYELARIFTEEKDAFLLNLAEARALQLAMGKMTVVDGQVQGQCPRAAGGDLDKLGEPFGVGRPPGFTDCCYWRLVLLTRFKPGPVTWLLAEIAELFSGIRPAVIEEPWKITLRWPLPPPPIPGGPRPGQHFWGDKGFWGTPRIGRPGGVFWSRGTGSAIPERHRSFWSHGTADAGSFFWKRTVGSGVPNLRDVLDQVRPAGVVVEIENLPRLGAIGCAGAAKRGAAPGRRGFWR